jgi:cell division protein FtsL
MKRGRGRARRVARTAGWLMLLLGSLAVVTWRQTEGVAREQQLREVRAERAIREAERLELQRRIHALSTRSRVVRVARERLGMHLPRDHEIVWLPLPPEAASAVRTRGAE